nr:hypothetical protein B0A51_16589 [Rachicladosporium sp. CCFEE 5018]
MALWSFASHALTAGGSLTLIFALAPLQHTVPLSMASSVSVTLNAVTLENVFNALEPNCSLAWFSLDTQKRRVAMEELPSSIPDLVKEAFVFASFCTREDRFVADALKTVFG